MGKIKSQLVFSDLTGGINNVDTKETINASPRRTETPDMLNVEYFGLGGIKSMEGNTQIGDTQDSAIVGGHEYTKGNKRYMMIATQDGNIKEYDPVKDKYNDVYKFNSKSDKVSFCNMNNGVVVTNGKDDLLFYEKGRNTQLTGVVNLDKYNKNKLYGNDTLFKAELRVGDYINIENCIGSYKVIDVESNTVATVDKDIELANGVKYYGWEGEKYTAQITSPDFIGEIKEISKKNSLTNPNVDLSSNTFERVGNGYNSKQYDKDVIVNGESLTSGCDNVTRSYEANNIYLYLSEEYDYQAKKFKQYLVLYGRHSLYWKEINNCIGFYFQKGLGFIVVCKEEVYVIPEDNIILNNDINLKNVQLDSVYSFGEIYYVDDYLGNNYSISVPLISNYASPEGIGFIYFKKNQDIIDAYFKQVFSGDLNLIKSTTGVLTCSTDTSQNTTTYDGFYYIIASGLYYANVSEGPMTNPFVITNKRIATNITSIHGNYKSKPFQTCLAFDNKNKLYSVYGENIVEKQLNYKNKIYTPINIFENFILAKLDNKYSIFYNTTNGDGNIIYVCDIDINEINIDNITNIFSNNITYIESILDTYEFNGNLFIYTEDKVFEINLNTGNIVNDRRIPFGYWKKSIGYYEPLEQKDLTKYNLEYNYNGYIPNDTVVEYNFNEEHNIVYSKTLSDLKTVDIYSSYDNSTKLDIDTTEIKQNPERIEYYTNEYVCRDYRNESLDKVNLNEKLPSDNLNINLTEISECNAYLVNTNPNLASGENIHTPIRGTAIQYYNGRLWVGTDNGLFYSAVGLHNNWDIFSDAGVLYSIYNDSSKIGALGLFSEYLMVHKEFSTYILTCSGESSTIEVKPFSNITCESQQGWIVSNTKYFVFSKDFLDIYPLIQHTVFNDKFLGEPVTQKVRNLFRDIRLEDTDKIFCVGRPRERQMIFYLPMNYVNGSSTALIFDFQTKSWLLRQVPQDVTTAFQYDNRIYIGTKDGKVLEEFKGDTFDGKAINAYYKSPWFDWTGDYTQSFSEFIIEIDNSVNNTFKINTYKDGEARTETRIINTDRLLNKSLIWGDSNSVFDIDDENWNDNNWAGGTFDTIRMVLPNNVFDSFQLKFSTDKDNPSFRIYKYGFRRIETEEVPW